MASHWSLSDWMSSQVSRSPLSILADIYKALVCIVSTRLLISKSSSLCINRLVTKNTNYNWYYFLNNVPQIFLIPSQGSGIYLSFRFLSYLLCSQPGQQNQQFGKYSFCCWLLLGLVIWSSGPNSGIRLCFKIPEEFERLIFQYRYWVVHIWFVRTVKFQFFEQFAMDHLAHTFVSCLLLFLW